MYKLLVVLIVFLLGLYYIFRFNRVEGFTTEKEGGQNISKNCPDVLIQKGSALFLYNSKRAEVPGVNPIKFENLDEYVEFTSWQRSQGILCPVLYLQHEFNAQGEAVYKARLSPTNLQGGLPDYYINERIMPPPLESPIMGQHDMANMQRAIIPQASLMQPAALMQPATKSLYPGFDAHDQDIGINTPLDNIFNQNKGAVSPNPMDSNWGGVEYTEKLIQAGVYKDNEVYKNPVLGPMF
jgi:hypothetical protein